MPPVLTDCMVLDSIELGKEGARGRGKLLFHDILGGKATSSEWRTNNCASSEEGHDG